MSGYTLETTISTRIDAPSIVELSPDGKFICIGGLSRMLIVINRFESTPPQPSNSYALSDIPVMVYWNSQFIFAGLRNGGVVIFFYHRDYDELVDGPFPLRGKVEYPGNGSQVLAASYDPKCHTLAFCTSNVIFLYELVAGEFHIRLYRAIVIREEPRRIGGSLLSLSFTTTGSLLVSHSVDGIILIEPRGVPPSWAIPGGHVGNPDNSCVRMVCYTRDGCILDVRHFWVDFITPKPCLLIGSGTTVVYDTGSGFLALKNAATNKQEQILRHSDDNVPIAFGYVETKNEQLIATVQSGGRSMTGVIKVWRVKRTFGLRHRILQVARVFTVRNICNFFLASLVLYATCCDLLQFLGVVYGAFISRVSPVFGDVAHRISEEFDHFDALLAGLVEVGRANVARYDAELQDVQDRVVELLRSFAETDGTTVEL